MVDTHSEVAAVLANQVERPPHLGAFHTRAEVEMATHVRLREGFIPAEWCGETPPHTNLIKISHPCHGGREYL